MCGVGDRGGDLRVVTEEEWGREGRGGKEEGVVVGVGVDVGECGVSYLPFEAGGGEAVEYEEGTCLGYLSSRESGRWLILFEDEETARGGGYELQTQLWPRPFTHIRPGSAKECEYFARGDPGVCVAGAGDVYGVDFEGLDGCLVVGEGKWVARAGEKMEGAKIFKQLK